MERRLEDAPIVEAHASSQRPAVPCMTWGAVSDLCLND